MLIDCHRMTVKPPAPCLICCGLQLSTYATASGKSKMIIMMALCLRVNMTVNWFYQQAADAATLATHQRFLRPFTFFFLPAEEAAGQLGIS